MKELDAFNINELTGWADTSESSGNPDWYPDPWEVAALARIALAAKRAEPDYYIVRLKFNDGWGDEMVLDTYETKLDATKSKDDHGGEIIPVYTTPQPPHIEQAKPVTMDSLRDAVAEMSGGLPMEWKEGNDKGHHAVPFINFNSLHRIVTKFTTPQLNSPEIPDGWKLVPNVVTTEMTDAARIIDGRLSAEKCHRIYRLMQAAAPESE